MAYTRFTFQGCGEWFVYGPDIDDPAEVRKNMKYIRKHMHSDVRLHENSWWGTVEYLINNPGCNWRQLSKTHRTSTGFIARCAPKATMNAMVVKTGTPGHFKYYASDLAKELYNKFKDVKPNEAELAKRKAKANAEYWEAIDEERRYRVLCESAKLQHEIDKTLE